MKVGDEEQVLNYLDDPRDYFNPFQDPSQSKPDPAFKNPCKAFSLPCSHLQNTAPLTGGTSFWTLSHCFGSSNKVFAKDSLCGCRPKKLTFSTVIQGASSCTALAIPSVYLAADRASLQPRFSLVSASSTVQSYIAYCETSERSHLQHLLHSKNQVCVTLQI